MTLLRQGFLLPNKKPRECGTLKKMDVTRDEPTTFYAPVGAKRASF